MLADGIRLRARRTIPTVIATKTKSQYMFIRTRTPSPFRESSGLDQVLHWHQNMLGAGPGLWLQKRPVAIEAPNRSDARITPTIKTRPTPDLRSSKL